MGEKGQIYRLKKTGTYAFWKLPTNLTRVIDGLYINPTQQYIIRHINPLMFGVIDNKPEGFIIYKHEPVGRAFIHYHINHERAYVFKYKGNFV